jgi:succinate dehydrogenase / fumarate reductase cytochrome b subunit
MNAVMTIYRSSIGKKAVVAVTGLIMFGFVFVHMAGNLLVYAGPEAYNAYAESLQANQALVWGVRLVLLGSLVAHVATIIQLVQMNGAARPQRYGKGLRYRASTPMSRHMKLGGLVLLAFIIYHLLHLTVGVAHGDFIRGDVYHNMTTGLKNPIVGVAYIVSMVALAAHLNHGAWSMMQTLGFNHPRYNDARKKFAMGFAGLILIGNASMPIAAMFGVIG